MKHEEAHNFYQFLVCGGTFDHFHRGHEAFLRYGLSHAETVLIGLTSDNFAKRKDSAIESYTVRRARIQSFLKSQGFEKRVKIEKIETNTIPTSWLDLSLEVLLVTEDTRKGAEEINTFLQSKQKQPLLVLIYPVALAETDEPISSSAIRSGLVDRSGKVYMNPGWIDHQLILPESLRAECQKILGTLLQEQEIPFEKLVMERVITVGDVITKTFLDRKLLPRLAVIDFIVERQKKFNRLSDLGFENVHAKRIMNPSGSIQPEVFQLFMKVLQSQNDKNGPTAVRIEGEEDLCALPAIICAPLGYTLFYGQPRRGVVMLSIDGVAKKRAKKLLDQFTLSPIG